MAPPNADQLKKSFIDSHGQETFSEGWDSVLRLDPTFFEAAVNQLDVPVKAKHLSPKVQAFASIAVNAATTHLHSAGIRTHIRAALAAGASHDEVMEVLELTCAVGIHACTIGVPVLFEVMKEQGIFDSHPVTGMKQLDKKREDLKATFTQKRGYWHSTWEEILLLDPDFFEANMNMTSVAWTKDPKTGQLGTGEEGQKGFLEPKVKELMYVAFDAACQHMYRSGLKLHMVNVLKYGGTPEEIMEVLELATLVGFQGASVGAPILEEEMKRK